MSYGHRANGWIRTTSLLRIRQVRRPLRHVRETCSEQESNLRPPASQTGAHPSSFQSEEARDPVRRLDSSLSLAVTGPPPWLPLGPLPPSRRCRAPRFDATSMDFSRCLSSSSRSSPKRKPPCRAARKKARTGSVNPRSLLSEPPRDLCRCAIRYAFPSTDRDANRQVKPRPSRPGCSIALYLFVRSSLVSRLQPASRRRSSGRHLAAIKRPQLPDGVLRPDAFIQAAPSECQPLFSNFSSAFGSLS